MSVINQMLKDLDKRQNQPEHELHSQVAIPVAKSSNKKTIIITLVALVFINVVGIYIWQLLEENERLQATHQHQSTQIVVPVAAPQFAPEQSNAVQQKQQPQKTQADVLSNNESKAVAAPVNEQINKASEKAKQTNSHRHSPEPTQQNQQAHDHTHQQEVAHSHPHKESNVASEKQGSKSQYNGEQKDPTHSPSTMSVSRKKMSPAQLVKHKLSEAERALKANKVSRAERLFEEVVVLDKNHLSARKQLAALWFGRQAYQSAINLLQQGIVLTPNDESLRLMQARIHLKQGNNQNALNSLVNLPESSREYLSLQGHLAQELEQFSQAVQSYQKLAELEPNIGRWWLGLAIAQDSQGNFQQAIEAYQQAVQQVDLSAETVDFALERIEVLGE